MPADFTLLFLCSVAVFSSGELNLCCCSRLGYRIYCRNLICIKDNDNNNNSKPKMDVTSEHFAFRQANPNITKICAENYREFTLNNLNTKTTMTTTTIWWWKSQLDIMWFDTRTPNVHWFSKNRTPLLLVLPVRLLLLNLINQSSFWHCIQLVDTIDSTSVGPDTSIVWAKPSAIFPQQHASITSPSAARIHHVMWSFSAKIRPKKRKKLYLYMTSGSL